MATTIKTAYAIRYLVCKLQAVHVHIQPNASSLESGAQPSFILMFWGSIDVIMDQSNDLAPF